MSCTFKQKHEKRWQRAFIRFRGLDDEGFSMWEIVWLQAAVYIAVDMLPVPGAQGITEVMFQSVFKSIFTEQYLPAMNSDA